MTTLMGDLETPPRLREDLRQRHRRATATTEFARALDALGIAQRQAARLFNVNVRHVRRWGRGDRRVPVGVTLLLRLLVEGVLTLDQIERVAVPAGTEDAQTGAKPRLSHRDPVRTNGGANPTLPAPLVVVPPALEQTALAADLDLTTAEKVFALASNVCRWPCGDPGRPGFRFCCSPTDKRPYCEHHSAQAYMAPPTRSLRRTTPFRFSAKRY